MKIYLFNKPKDITSYDVIRRLKTLLRPRKIGHGGSLDPLAEGLLIIGIDEGTKELTKFLKSSTKEYIAEIVLGQESDTYDIKGKITKNQITDIPEKKDILNALDTFKGKTLQTPPKYSAIKISGKPAYKLARQDKEFKIEPKEVEILDIQLLDYAFPKIKVKLLVKSGFYVRSLAHDLGIKLKTGALLSSLQRTKINDFTIQQALSFEDIERDFIELYFKAQGRVQGVFFRDTTRRWAKSLNLTGRAVNLANKETEVIAQGKVEDLNKLLGKIKRGPMLARVDSYISYFRKPRSKYSIFSIF